MNVHAAVLVLAMLPTPEELAIELDDALNNGTHVSLYQPELQDCGRTPVHGYQSVHRIVQHWADESGEDYSNV